MSWGTHAMQGWWFATPHSKILSTCTFLCINTGHWTHSPHLSWRPSPPTLRLSQFRLVFLYSTWTRQIQFIHCRRPMADPQTTAMQVISNQPGERLLPLTEYHTQKSTTIWTTVENFTLGGLLTRDPFLVTNPPR